MAIYYRAQSDTVERFLFTTEGYLLSDYLLRHNSKCVKHCVGSVTNHKPTGFIRLKRSLSDRDELITEGGRYVVEVA